MRIKNKVPCAKVAIVVPCYNHGPYLAECLTSVINQTFTDWICIVVDDGSRDNSGKIAMQFSQTDSRFHYLRQKNLGVSVARNNGIGSCQSDYILPLDADDMIAPTYLERTVFEADRDTEVKIVYTYCHLFGLINQPFDLPDYSFKLLLQRNLITATALFRRSDYSKTNGYDENLIVGWEDWDFWISLLNQDSNVIKVNEPLLNYRQNEKSRNRSLTGKQIQRIRRYVYYKHINKYKQFSEDPEILRYRIRILEQEIREKDILGRLKRKIFMVTHKKLE